MEIPCRSQDLWETRVYCPTMHSPGSRAVAFDPVPTTRRQTVPRLRLVGGAAGRTRGAADAQAAEDLAGRLIQAQEDERKRIAMELHDDLNQKLAALAIGLTHLDDQLGTGGPDLREQVGALEKLATRLSEDVRQLSHRLHPASIQHVGLVAGLRSLCAAFGQEKGIEVLSRLRDLHTTPAPAVVLALYRIAQEALRNVHKHARATEVRVSLVETGSTLRLSITDNGDGFDPETVDEGAGLGLVSMKERGRHLGGTLRVRSSLEAGTEVAVSVPHPVV